MRIICSPRDNKKVEANSDTPDIYKSKKLCTKNEMKFYYALRKALPKKNNFMIHCQTPLRALFEPINKDNKAANRNLGSKRFDFVITDNNLNVIVIIELDDFSHNHPDRIRRDKFVENTVDGLYDLIRFDGKLNYYDHIEIRKSLIANTDIFNNLLYTEV